MKILSIQQQFENGRLNIKQFFDKAADLYEDDLVVDTDDDDDDEDVTSEDSVVDETDDNCEKCHLNLNDTMFIPCLHLKFCSDCVDTLLANSAEKCPECNEKVSERLQVFLWYYYQPLKPLS